MGPLRAAAKAKVPGAERKIAFEKLYVASHVGEGVKDVREQELGQCRGTQRHEAKRGEEHERLRAEVVLLAAQFGRYGYRRVTALVRAEGSGQPGSHGLGRELGAVVAADVLRGPVLAAVQAACSDPSRSAPGRCSRPGVFPGPAAR